MAGTHRHGALTLLLVDDEEAALRGMENALQGGGFSRILCRTDGESALAVLAAEPVDLMLLDLRMPGLSGEEVLRRAAALRPEVPVVVITALDDLDTVVTCMRLGARDYLVKPVERERLLLSVRNLAEVLELRRGLRALEESAAAGPTNPAAFAGIVTAHPAMRALFRYVEAVAPTARPVLVTGQTGTGKEIFARALHACSGRDGSFVAINCAGVDDPVLADTLFGHVRGAFTGAERVRAGLVEEAAGGTLFLDEIGDLPEASQGKLLRLVQEGEYLSVGGDQPKKSTARIVAATNRDLAAAMEAGRFRRDLFHRLAVHRVQVPPLSERTGDIPLLVRHFTAQAAAETGRPIPDLPATALALFASRPWPGNVRELGAAVFEALSRGGGRLDLATLREIIRPGAGNSTDALDTPNAISFPDPLPTLKACDRLLVAEALRRSGGNQTAAARMLGISQPALSQRLKAKSGG